MGIGDWGLGIGDWTIPNPQSPKTTKNKNLLLIILKVFINVSEILN